MIWALWWGGPNYAAPYIEDVESFSSVAAAKRHLAYRLRNTSGYHPGVTLESEMHVFFADPREVLDGSPRRDTDPYPDLILSFGPRGGVQERPA